MSMGRGFEFPEATFLLGNSHFRGWCGCRFRGTRVAQSRRRRGFVGATDIAVAGPIAFSGRTNRGQKNEGIRVMAIFRVILIASII
jgi:hypothetical protein